MGDLDPESREGRAPIIAISLTHVGIVCPQKEIPCGIPTNFGLFQAAKKHMRPSKEEEQSLNSTRKRIERISLGEVDYKAFYDDFTIHHKQEWDDFFQHPENGIHLKFACAVLMLLSDVFIFRCSYEACGEVLDIHSNTTDIFNPCSTHVPPVTRNELISEGSNYEQLKYSENAQRATLNLRLKRYAISIPVMRDLCAYEAKYPSSSHLVNGQRLTLEKLRLCLNSPQYNPTLDEIHALPEEVWMEVIQNLNLILFQ